MPRIPFDPDQPSQRATLFGLPPEAETARIHVLPIPFEATCSYGRGTRHGPEAIRRASLQLDLYDEDYGETWRSGIYLHPSPEWEHPPDNASLEQIATASRQRSAGLRAWTETQLAEGRIPAVLGGDHSSPLGAIEAAANAGELSILHIDAHMDLRQSYEGFEESHASIMHNVLTRCPGVEGLVQVGIRDYSAGEIERAKAEGQRVQCFFMRDWRRHLAAGLALDQLLDQCIAGLGSRVWISFDIDGLDPAFCPHTGTPVPGGLQFGEASQLLWRLAQSKRRIIGFDLCEVFGHADPVEHPAQEWDANVGARILYKLCGAATFGER
ncbi:MAG: hypothetical protein CSA62_09595 [Planctomycetota bacterium]|nr:MAG: hypothetical protein CSA62_09595 [Planctomycetota bacterium]